MDFKVKTLNTSIDLDGVELGDTCKGQSSKSMNVKFKNEIARFCNEGAIVFIFLSGLQFPCKASSVFVCLFVSFCLAGWLFVGLYLYTVCLHAVFPLCLVCSVIQD